MNPNTESPDLAFDHVVIIVPDLDRAMSDFRSLGFVVEPGGTTGPLHNALIFFRDGAYIELMSAVSAGFLRALRILRSLGMTSWLYRRNPNIRNRFIHTLGGPAGLRDWCLRCRDLDRAIPRFEQNGLRVCAPSPFRRVRPDGIEPEWRLAGAATPFVPFFIEDLTPTEYRVPWQDFSDHPNGVTSIAALTLPALQGRDALDWIRSEFADEAAPDSTPRIGDVEIRFSEDPSTTHLALELRTADPAKRGRLPLDQTSGATIDLV